MDAFHQSDPRCDPLRSPDHCHGNRSIPIFDPIWYLERRLFNSHHQFQGSDRLLICPRFNRNQREPSHSDLRRPAPGPYLGHITHSCRFFPLAILERNRQRNRHRVPKYHLLQRSADHHYHQHQQQNHRQRSHRDGTQLRCI